MDGLGLAVVDLPRITSVELVPGASETEKDGNG